MATFFPPDPPPDGPNRYGEWIFWHKLRDALKDDQVDVYFWVRFFLDLKNTRQREIDCVVLHPGFGALMVIEVKGGQYGHDPARGWCYIKDRKWEPDREGGGAFDQANTAENDLMNTFANRTGYKKSDQVPLAHIHGVALPNCILERVDGRLPPTAEGRVLIEMKDIANPAALRSWVIGRLKGAVEEWPKKLGVDEKAAVVNQFRKFLRPSALPSQRLAAMIAGDAALQDRLTEQQRFVVKGYLGHRDVVISGPAGTGKTFLAVLAASHIAKLQQESENPRSVLLLCYNANLASQIRDHMLGQESGVVVHHFHGLCQHQVALSGLKPSSNLSPADRAAWLEDQFLDACAGEWTERYAAVLVDEAQDFKLEWLQQLKESVCDPEGAFWVLYDPLQAIYGGHITPKDVASEFGQPFMLTENCRNTRQICDFVRNVKLEDLKLWRSGEYAPTGPKPKVLRFHDGPDQLNKIGKLIRCLIHEDEIRPNQIVLLSPFQKKNTCLADVDQIGELPLVDYAERSKVNRENVIFYETLHSFKGCEADVCIVHDVRGTGANVDAKELYVALSRARFALFVLAAEDFRWPGADKP